MIKTTWGNSLTQVGFVWQNEEHDRSDEASVVHCSTEKQSEELKCLLRGEEGEGGGERGKGRRCEDLDLWQV